MTFYEKYNASIRGEYTPTKAESIVFAILWDFTDRRGLKQEWHSIDEDIQEEIIHTWVQKVAAIVE